MAQWRRAEWVRGVVLALLLGLTAGCQPLEPSLAVGLVAPAAGHAAVGVPVAGFPSWSERMVHVLVNRARTDPQADLASCSHCAEAACYGPVAPLSYSYQLNRAARFHSGNLSRTGSHLQHDSPCTLVPDLAERYPPEGECLGEASCACVDGALGCQGSCPRFSSRVGLFGAGARRENAASGGDPLYVFYLWLHESDSSEACGWRYSNGHRYNILADDISAIGAGQDGYWTQDFGSGSSAGPLSVGAHYPQSGSASTAFAFRAQYHSAGAPRRALLSLDGSCQALGVEVEAQLAGSYSATYLVETALGDSGCHRYHFVFEDETGQTHSLPSEGSYGVGGSGCEDWLPERPTQDSSCGACVPSCGDRLCGDDGCGGRCGLCGAYESCSAGACACRFDSCGGECCAEGEVCGVGGCALPAPPGDGDDGGGGGFDASGQGDAGSSAETPLPNPDPVAGDSLAGSGAQRVALGEGLSCRATGASSVNALLLTLGLWRRGRRRSRSAS